MTALRSFFSARISSCSDSNSRTSSSVYSYVLTRLSSSNRVDMLTRTLADSGPFRSRVRRAAEQAPQRRLRGPIAAHAVHAAAGWRRAGGEIDPFVGCRVRIAARERPRQHLHEV